MQKYLHYVSDGRNWYNLIKFENMCERGKFIRGLIAFIAFLFLLPWLLTSKAYLLAIFIVFGPIYHLRTTLLASYEEERFFLEQPLLWAVEKRHSQLIALLLQNEPSLIDKRGGKLKLTPLHAAVELNDIPLTKTLLDHGARVDVGDVGGETPLHVAAGEGYEEMTKLLLEQGADPERQNSDGETPLDLAKEIGKDKIVELFPKKLANQGSK